MEDRYLEDKREPPEEPEAKFCDSCDEEMQAGNWYEGRGMKLENLHCVNCFCPAKFDGQAYAMAIALLECKDDIRRMKHRIKQLENS